MTYVMADIHGEYVRFLDMLDKIKFSNEDTLYIIGDMIDHGPDGISVVQYVMRQDNIHALLGNHELICKTALKTGDLTRWQNEGGQPTIDAYAALSEGEKEEILRFISSLPDHLDIKVGRKKFHLVHAWPGKTTKERVWTRPSLESKNPFWDRRRVIIGHTPVHILNIAYLASVASGIGQFRIEKANGFIDIDCGCGYLIPQRRLACLRLDDMAEFYV